MSKVLDALQTYTFHGRVIPYYMHGGLDRYITQHKDVGEFLRAIFEGDLYEAAGHADDMNINLLHVYVAFMHNHAPSAAFGNADKVAHWLKMPVIDTRETA
jgi:hypothetical protein